MFLIFPSNTKIICVQSSDDYKQEMWIKFLIQTPRTGFLKSPSTIGYKSVNIARSPLQEAIIILCEIRNYLTRPFSRLTLCIKTLFKKSFHLQAKCNSVIFKCKKVLLKYMIKIVSNSSLRRPSVSRCIWTVRNLNKDYNGSPNQPKILLARTKRNLQRHSSEITSN